jgi:GDP-mannose 6-dehydrogenase
MKLCVIGMEYAGVVTAACLARAGHQVIAVDNNTSTVRALAGGISPVNEEGLSALLQCGVQERRLEASSDIIQSVVQADATLITLPTECPRTGRVDTRELLALCSSIGSGLKNSLRPHTVIIRSNVLPGTCRNNLIPAIEEAAQKTCDEHLGVCYNPHFLREGTALMDFYSPPFTLVGRDSEHHGSLCAALYTNVNAQLERSSIELAEMLKYACNSFHVTKASFASEMANVGVERDLSGERKILRLMCVDRMPAFSNAI